MLGVLAAVGAALRPLGRRRRRASRPCSSCSSCRWPGVRPGVRFRARRDRRCSPAALLTGGVGPWLPFQMFAAAWMGLFAGAAPAARGRRELVLLAAYGVVARRRLRRRCINMWFWPFAAYGPEVTFVPGDSLQRTCTGT